MISHRVCHTNTEWKALADTGNRDARDAVEGSAAGGFQPSSL